MLIQGGKGSGKTCLLFDVLQELHIPCFILHVYDMTIQCGSDAYKAMEVMYTQAKQVAPSVLLIDPLYMIAADNKHKRIDRSDVDTSLLQLLSHIMKEGKEHGVTVIGVMNDDTMITSSVLNHFDEKVGVPLVV